MLIHAGVVRTDTDADPMDYRIKLFARKRVPGSLQNIHPVLIALRNDELVLDLEIELSFTTVENAFDNDVIERIAEGGALRLNTGDRKSTRLNSSHLGISYAVF